MTTDDDARRTVAALVEAAKIAYVTTVTPEGQLVSRPLGVQQRGSFDGDLWFFTEDPSNKKPSDPGQRPGQRGLPGRQRVRLDQRHRHHLARPGGDRRAVELRGRGLVRRGQGRSEPRPVAGARRVGEEVCWTIDQPMAVTMLKYAKARITGGARPDVGTNEAVDL